MGIFKSYDVRGIINQDLDESIAEKIGYAFVKFLNANTIVVGHDMRLSGEQLCKAFTRGANKAGCKVVNIGLVSTPMIYFATGFYKYDGGAMTTASHNPPQWNGFKFCREEAIPISYDTGIGEIEKIVKEIKSLPIEYEENVENKDIWEDYRNHVLKFAGNIKPMKIVVDAGNGMGGKIVPYVFEKLPQIEIIPLYFELDGNFPNHEANPLKPENMVDLQKKVKEVGADLGVAFDGDADRVVFVNEKGEIISCDMVTALISTVVLSKEKGASIVYDLRSSRIVPETIKEHGGKPVRGRVGHSHMKAMMRKENAPFGGELSGHYYFRENFYADSGIITLLSLLTVISEKDKPISEIISPLQKYYATGEINFEVEDKDEKIKLLAEKYSDAKIDYLDGITISYNDWWCNVRPSNTEPVLRLNLEANTPELRDEKRKEIETLLRE